MAIINGTAGNDQLSGTSGADQLYGLDGNDTLIGGGGADQLFGGAGLDSASYQNAQTGISINLRTGIHGGDAAGDTFDNIEIFTGSNYGDVFYGDANGNRFDGGANIDIINYSQSPSAVNVNLSTGVVSGGDAAGDVLSNIETVVGSSFNDTLAASDSRSLQGGAGDDVYVIGSTVVTVYETSNNGNDEVQTALASLTLPNEVERLTYTGSANFTGYGNSGNNVLQGGIGNDTLLGGAGADQLRGGAGTDSASYQTAQTGISINLRTGIHGGDAAGDTFDNIEIFTGSNYGDVFYGDANGNRFDGGAGIDIINYSQSPSAVNVNLSTGVVSGGDAAGDVLSNIETVVGSGFNDTLAASDSRSLQGGAGDDVYVIGSTVVTVYETANNGNDEVQTALASLTLPNEVERLTYTGSANFTGYGNSGNNVLQGGSGNDTLLGGAGADQLLGGAGTDSANYQTAQTGISINLRTGIHGGDAAGDTFDNIEIFTGSNYGDVFYGDANGNRFDGGANIDIINYSQSPAAVNVNLSTGVVSGGDAAGDVLSNIETVVGSSFNDTLAASDSRNLQGGAGDDVYVIGSTVVTVYETANNGNDEVQTALASLTLPNEVERLTYTGSANFTGYGNSGNNVLQGGIGNDTLLGGAGADQLLGGAGTDSASYQTAQTGISINLRTGIHGGDAAGDTFDNIEIFTGSNYGDVFYGDANGNRFDGGANIDIINYSQSPSAVNVNLSTGVVSGGDAAGDVLSNIETVVGSGFNDTLAASDSRNLQGGAGDDVYVIGSTVVTVYETANNGNDEVQTALASLTLANEVERLTYTGSANFTGYGNSGNNVLQGGIGNDTLLGGAGADQLLGGAGLDSASYQNAQTGISINLRTGIHGGDAAGDTFDNIEIFTGSNYGDVFYGDANGNRFDGGANIDIINYSQSPAAVNVNLSTGVVSGGDAAGDVLSNIETVVGSGFNDILAASDSRNLQGGAGDDVYVIGSTVVTVYETSNNGNDEVQTALASLTLTNEVERLTYTGSANFTGYGNSGNNVLQGGSGNDTLIGGGGSDTLIGGDGIDVASYINANGVTINLKTGAHAGDASVDVFVNIEIFSGSNYADSFFADANPNQFIGGAGEDTINYSLSTDAVWVDLSSGKGQAGDAQGDVLSQIETVIGSAFGDTLLASDQRNLYGGQGNDVYVIGANTVRIYENAAEGVDEVQTALPVLSLATLSTQAFVEKLTYTGSANFTGYGNAADNIITGGAGNDTLYGGAGADQFIGGAGLDVVSYADSTQAVTFDFATGVYSGIAAGDSFSGIELIQGSNLGDIFIAGAGSDVLDGGNGVDLLSYQASPVAITLDMELGTGSGYVNGDKWSNIEVVQGSAYADSLRGNLADNIFMGGAGADSIDGAAGIDSAWYLLSPQAVQINLQTGAVAGGDAEGDQLQNIEGIAGSAFNDQISGNDLDNVLQGGAGNDTIFGGNGNDTIYASLSGTGSIIALPNSNQADEVHGGNGNDTVHAADQDSGTVVYGDSGADTILVNNGTAFGGDDNDSLAGYRGDALLFGEQGDDSLALYDGGLANGGEGSDKYYANSSKTIVLEEYGSIGSDRVILNLIHNADLRIGQLANDNGLVISTAEDFADGQLDSGVYLPNWFGGNNSIEYFVTADNSYFTVSHLTLTLTWL